MSYTQTHNLPYGTQKSAAEGTGDEASILQPYDLLHSLEQMRMGKFLTHNTQPKFRTFDHTRYSKSDQVLGVNPAPILEGTQ